MVITLVGFDGGAVQVHQGVGRVGLGGFVLAVSAGGGEHRGVLDVERSGEDRTGEWHIWALSALIPGDQHPRLFVQPGTGSRRLPQN